VLRVAGGHAHVTCVVCEGEAVRLQDAFRAGRVAGLRWAANIVADNHHGQTAAIILNTVHRLERGEESP
jgi:hypothetical protein